MKNRFDDYLEKERIRGLHGKPKCNPCCLGTQQNHLTHAEAKSSLERLAEMACGKVQRFTIAGLPERFCFSRAKEPKQRYWLVVPICGILLIGGFCKGKEAGPERG